MRTATIQQIIAAYMLGMIFNSNVAMGSVGVGVDVGAGDKATVYKVSMQQPWRSTLTNVIPFAVTPYFEWSIAQINENKYQNINNKKHAFTVYGLTPIFRHYSTTYPAVFFELGSGINLMTNKFNNDGTMSSTRFQFGDHIGLGYKFNNAELMIKFQHYSNGHLKTPNPAVNFVMAKLVVNF